MNKCEQNKEIEEEGPEDFPREPFDPGSIGISRRTFSIDNLVKRMQRDAIVLAPPYQRREVWGIEKKSQLIESLLLRIPLPSFYMAEDDKGRYEVVDGQQRLSAIRDFFFSDGPAVKSADGKGFRLKGLEFLSSLEGHNYEELNNYFQQNIDEAQVDLIVIDNNTPEDVKFIIFSRINRGGLALNDQEVRHALYNGSSTELLEALSNYSLFHDNFSSYFPATYMIDREVILRSLSFIVRPYTAFDREKRMTDFLAETMLIINAMPDFTSFRFLRKFTQDDIDTFLVKDIDSLRKRFKRGLKRSLDLFGKHTFRRSYGEQRRTTVNKSLFEVWIALLSSLSNNQFDDLLYNKDAFFKEYIKILNKDIFKRSIASDALSHTGIMFRYTSLKECLDAVTS